VLLPNSLNRFRSSLLIALVAGLCVAQIPSLNLTEDVRRVGSKIRCTCGVCRNSMGDCPMLGCHSAVPGRAKIAKLQAEGKSDDAIVAVFVKENGRGILVEAPAEGIGVALWLLVPLALALGLGSVYWWIQRNRRPAIAGEVPAEVLDRFQKQADEELTKLDS